MKFAAVFGVAINAIGVVVGGLFGATRKTTFSVADESFFKVGLGAATAFIGLHLTWTNINGSIGSILKQLLLVLVAMSLGKFFGKTLRLQKMSNSIGKYASDKL
ncbi:MAG: DUF554 family protein, partial [Limisphaerales bacterium]